MDVLKDWVEQEAQTKPVTVIGFAVSDDPGGPADKVVNIEFAPRLARTDFRRRR